MIKILCAVLWVMLGSAGLGLTVEKKLGLRPSMFPVPLGLVTLLFVLQLCYYPVQFFNGSVFWIYAASLIVLSIATVLALMNLKTLLQRFWRKELLWVAASFAVFLFVFYH